MFKTLINEARLTVELRVDGPLLIRSGEANSMDPSLPDMRFVRCKHNGEQTVYLPGSSLKGVFRARYEKLVKAQPWGQKPCNLFDRFNNCTKKLQEKHNRESAKDGTQRYNESCPACRLFGSSELGSRIRFTDAYPVDPAQVKMGMRNGVGIDRKTGAASNGALYDFEVVENGVFRFDIHLTNFEHYQLALIMEILSDIDNGYVGFGMGTSRGNGSMKVNNQDDLPLTYRSYKNEMDLQGMAAAKQDLFAKIYELQGRSAILEALGIQNEQQLQEAFNKKGWSEVLIYART